MYNVCNMYASLYAMCIYAMYVYNLCVCNVCVCVMCTVPPSTCFLCNEDFSVLMFTPTYEMVNLLLEVLREH